MEAQHHAVAQFTGGAPLLAEFEEIESGRHHRIQPQLAAAIDVCRKQRATLVIAKLDRLVRNVHFVPASWKARLISWPWTIPTLRDSPSIFSPLWPRSRPRRFRNAHAQHSNR
ncbi:recombinase family protein [Acidisarcina polymorpha]|uniref:recombinase family protein n=1 Tax=Acidisarcina polymorpha TaxID=2211140 RepID=UPI001F015DB8|nr:recombinase family protein [Acidisarcina polymorpha]